MAGPTKNTFVGVKAFSGRTKRNQVTEELKETAHTFILVTLDPNWSQTALWSRDLLKPVKGPWIMLPRFFSESGRKTPHISPATISACINYDIFASAPSLWPSLNFEPKVDNRHCTHVERAASLYPNLRTKCSISSYVTWISRYLPVPLFRPRLPFLVERFNFPKAGSIMRDLTVKAFKRSLGRFTRQQSRLHSKSLPPIKTPCANRSRTDLKHF